MPIRAKIAAFLGAAAAFALLPLFQPPAFYESLLYLVFFWVALATSWAILSGFSGYFSFGHGAFYGAGVYTTAAVASRFDIPLVLTWLASGLVASLLGIAIGAVIFRLRRLRGELFALLTLAVTFVIATIVLNTRIDGGPGVFLSGVKLPDIFGRQSSTIYLLGVVIAFASLATAWFVQYSRLGRGLFAISDDEDVAEVMGVPTYRYKLMALGLSCFLAGVAGGIHAVFVTYVTISETFSVVVPVSVVLMSVLGGARHWLGPALGAAFITLLNYAFVGGEWAVIGRAIIGAILILVILFLPHGIAGFVAQRWRRLRPAAVSEPPASSGARPPIAAPTAVPKPAQGGVLLRCEDVQLAFRGVRALAGVTLDVRQGEILGIVGPNGSGKSTLVNAISGYYRPDAGRILFGGTNLVTLPAHRIAELGLARTYQIPRPCQRLTVTENVALAGMFGAAALDRPAALSEARHWLDFVGLGERAASLPAQLNLHQRKFLELARALASRPRLVMLDEVLSGLTPTEIAGAVALIREIRQQGATVIFIEHNMRAVLELTERLVVLNYGQVIAEGLPRDVVRQPDVIKAYLGTAHV
ncbi:MAG: branched-chain amino acid ABC transporter ATP-binding protein/permease [Alphaproteobacteria bacterium]|nr:branched-chain amino acid ABC transporter ATP-binding protein/permease [Alphaproteobacteria bacterium]